LSFAISRFQRAGPAAGPFAQLLFAIRLQQQLDELHLRVTPVPQISGEVQRQLILPHQAELWKLLEDPPDRRQHGDRIGWWQTQ